MQATVTATHAPPGTAAAAWIDLRHAMVARSATDGSIEIVELRRPAAVDEPVEQWLAVVADAIGDHERVVILGSGPLRLALEREYVSIFHRPDRIVDVEPSEPVGREELIRRVAELRG
jgi:hypothetical protein